ncbi:MAG: hypothetical protein JSS34_06340 [Proteobacteria bacterium]|nr:hypothetical protein [Pseudomonadota bacterium]
MINPCQNCFFKSLYLFLGILTLSACSENLDNFPNLAGVGERPVSPSLKKAQNEISTLEKDRTLILKKTS